MISLAFVHWARLHTGDSLKYVHGKHAIDDRHVLTETIQNYPGIGGSEV